MVWPNKHYFCIMQLNHKTFGQGPPLLVLHGLFGTLDNWQTLAKRWAEHFTVFIVDQRNHGRSPHADVINYPTLADDLHLFMEEHWIYKAHVLGHSMGGKTAMQFALQYPDMVDKLIVVDIAPKSYAGGHEVILDALLSLDLPNLNDRKEAEALLEQRIPEYGVRQFLLKNLTRDANGGFAWKMNLPSIYNHYADILADVDAAAAPFEGPALFVRGSRSDYITDADWPALKERFAQAELATIEGAGHWVHADQPDALFATVQAFLEA